MRPFRGVQLALLLIVAFAAQLPVMVNGDDEVSPEDAEFVKTKILPLLETRCYECHGPRAAKAKGGLRFGSRELLLKGGDSGPAIQPGKPDESLLIEAINYQGFEMPPRSKLPAGEIALLTRWIEMGAPWPKNLAATVVADDGEFPLQQRKASHWSWKPLTNPDLPDVDDAGWSRRDLDQFVLSRLEEAGLKPNPAADRRTLIRRAYYAVIGLPPQPEQVRAFLDDPAETREAFARVVDELLESRHFGEHWARHWLDLARYGETLGHEFDYPLRYAYQYRDYVIRAFNADVPYDQFVREQIAGDLIETPRRHPEMGFNESIIGTGFWFMGEMVHAPVDVRKDEADRIDNQIDVFSKTFLGLTVACARCHDHKFDAISTRDYYALSGFLQSSRRDVGMLDPHGRIRQSLEKISELRSQIADTVSQALQPDRRLDDDQIARYLLAAHEVLHSPPLAAEPDMVFEDFERDTYEGWEVTGTAFGPGPQSQATLAKYQGVVGFHGTRGVNSHHKRKGGRGDADTGTLTSREFTIQHSFIRFLIGGGSHRDKTCVNLLVDDKVVRSETGRSKNQMHETRFDVSDLSGKTARIQVVDNHAGGWGNIGLDHIVFTNDDGTSRKQIEAVAEEKQLDADLLERWTQQLPSEQTATPSHPLWAWHRIVGNDVAPSPETIAQRYSQARKDRDIAAAAFANTDAASTVFADFNSTDFGDWLPSGHAFGRRPTQSLNSDSLAEAPDTIAAGVAHSGLASTKLCGVLRSPTFELKHRRIFYRVAGRNARIRVIIDGFVMDEFNALLFRGAKMDVNTDGKFQWIQQAGDVSRYVGHRAHIELIDDGDGWIAVDQIRFSDEATVPQTPPHPLTYMVLAAKSPSSLEGLAGRYATSLSGSLRRSLAGPAPIAFEQIADMAVAAQLVLPAETAKRVNTLREELQAEADRVASPMRVVAMVDGPGEDGHVFIRGSHTNLGPVVPRRLPEALADGDQPPIPNGSGRLSLAERLLAPTNPYPARVMANRIWHHLMGRGIVPSVDNFGVLGQRPTHPELLDHLATRFVEQGWSVKSLIREIVLSSTWGMSSAPESVAEQADPQNRLWHRAEIRRMSGEAIRDTMLSLSGRLNTAAFGPSVPVHLTSFMQGRGRPGNNGALDGNGRRSIYIEVRRNFLSPMMMAFDTPIPFTSMGRRSVSNVPAQALILLNDPFVIQQAAEWSKRILEPKDVTPELRVRSLYEAAFAREPTSAEIADAIAFVKAEASADELTDNSWQTNAGAWKELCHVMMNVKEFIFVN